MQNYKKRFNYLYLIILALVFSFEVAFATETDSGGGQDGHILIVRLFLVLAITKIAQRVDSYLNTLGLSAAQGGSDLLGAIMAGASMLGARGSGGGGKGSAGAVLGSGAAGKTLREALGSAARAPYGQKFKALGESLAKNTNMGRAISKGMQTAKEKTNVSKGQRVFDGIGTAAIEAAKGSRFGQTVSTISDAAKSEGNTLGDRVRGGVKGVKQVTGAAIERDLAKSIPFAANIGRAVAQEQDDAVAKEAKETHRNEQLRLNPSQNSVAVTQKNGNIDPDIEKAISEGNIDDSAKNKLFNAKGYDSQQGLAAFDGDITGRKDADIYGVRIQPDDKDGFSYDENGYAPAVTSEMASHFFNGKDYATRMKNHKEAMDIVADADRSLSESWVTSAQKTGNDNREAQRFINHSGNLNSTNPTVTNAAAAAYGNQFAFMAQKAGISLGSSPSSVITENNTETSSGGKVLTKNHQTITYPTQNGKQVSFDVVTGPELHSFESSTDGSFTPKYSNDEKQQFEQFRLADGTVMFARMQYLSSTEPVDQQQTTVVPTYSAHSNTESQGHDGSMAKDNTWSLPDARFTEQWYEEAASNKQNSEIAYNSLSETGYYNGSDHAAREAAAAAYHLQAQRMISTTSSQGFDAVPSHVVLNNQDVPTANGTIERHSQQVMTYNLEDGRLATMEVLNAEAFATLSADMKKQFEEFSIDMNRQKTAYARISFSENAASQYVPPVSQTSNAPRVQEHVIRGDEGNRKGKGTPSVNATQKQRNKGKKSR